MDFLQISLTNKCNFNCWHCPMAEWRNSTPPNLPLCNAELIPFLEKYVDSRLWVIELTGGEPSLYPEIDELMEWLHEKKYRVLVKTNGSGNLKHYDNSTIVAAFHKLEEPPQNYDIYLIVDKIDREKKERYCIDHNIPYRVIGYNKENPDGAKHGFTYCAYINPAGHQVGCCADAVPQNVQSDGRDHNRIDFKPLTVMKCCSRCKAAIDAWRFL